MPDRSALHQRLHHTLTSQPPRNNNIIVAFEQIRVHAKVLGDAIIDTCPLGREQSLALTHLEETVMWAVKAIALNQDEIQAPA